MFTAHDMPLPSLAKLALASGDIGMKRKQRTTDPGGGVTTRRTEAPDSLDVNGVATFPLTNQGEVAEFLLKLRRCTNTWFQQNLTRMLTEPPDGMFKSAKEPFTPYNNLIDGRLAWNKLDPHARRMYMGNINLQTEEGMALVFSNGELEKRAWWNSMPGKEFFKRAVQYVKMGNSGMGLANMAESWSAKGFGKWAHIVPDIGLPMVIEAMKMMERLGLPPGEPEHFPHLIYKPPSGSPLEIHHDQISSYDLVTKLQEFVNTASDPSMTEWVRREGMQMLAHLQGGTGLNDGATFIVGPMTPAKLLICLEAYSSGRVGGDYATWNSKKRGKIDLPWEEHINAFNQLLTADGHERIALLPAAPEDTTMAKNGFGLLFPVGSPHGSFANASEEDVSSGKGSRITLTLPITMRGSAQTPDPRTLTRLRMMAVLSTNGLTGSQYAEAEIWLSRDKRAYADGPTHKNPWKVVNLIRCPDAATALNLSVGPYHSISVKVPTVDNYLVALAKIARGERLIDAPGPQ